MRLILIRHTESLKNVTNQFSSETDEESLTTKGREECSLIAYNIRDFMIRRNLVCHSIYSANSVRSIDTARIIADELSAKVQVEEALRSTKPGTLTGKSEAEAIKTNPKFIEQLYLFRNGLFNAYDFTVAENKEPKKDFEKRVLTCLYNILADESESLKIVIAHRSSITCILLELARKYYKYPENFSGHVPLDLGRLSLTERTDDNNWKIVKVNCKSSELEEL
jgi:broad specificity phosphatase PhoE